ncbi:MAG TPA: HAMP domain-containing sensor histidine kinase [Kineosporiaceae bacterium]|nr:HAMP domain-containing sensor histidine kinase [Kineosporiaceae bacterium]
MPADAGSGRSYRALSVRARLTMATTGVVAIALALGAILLVLVLHAWLLRQRDDAARAQALGVAALVTSGRVPDVLPSGGTTVLQVVDAQGRVTATSPGGDRLVPLLDAADLRRARAGEAVELPGRRLGVDEPLRVVGVPAGSAADPQTVLVAAPVGDLENGLGVVGRIAAVAVVLLVAGVAVLSRWLVGSALRPVEELTRGAESLPGAPDARALLPVPAADDEVRRLAVTLNAMIERIRASSRRQRAFVGDAAHELRSPLASIRTAVEVARLHPNDGDWAQVADGVLDDTARMGRLVDDLLLLARLDEGALRGGFTPAADAAAVADDVVDRLGRQLPGGVALVRTGATTARTAASRDVVDRIAVNLVENALRYARSRVEVCVEALGSAVVLAVADDGPGVPDADRERVFERFTRLDDDRSRASGGSGLGLAIVRELATAAGGNVALEDAGPGLRAVVTLPGA